MSLKDNDSLAREVARAQMQGVKEGRSDIEIENEIACAYKRLGEEIPYEYTDEGRQEKRKMLEEKSKKENVQVKRDSIIFLAIIVIIAITMGISVHKNNDRLYEEYYEAYYHAQVESFMNSRFHVGLLTLKIAIDAEQTAYNHLGEDISIEHFCNGTSISNRDTIKAQNKLTFTTVITENDSIDDVGKKTITIDLPPFTQSEKISIKVVEKGGTKYKNAYATWDITYTITPVLDGMAEIERRDVIEWAKSLQD